MALEHRLCVCCLAIVKCLVLLAVVCYPAAHASQPRALPFPAHGLSRPSRPSSDVSYPYICPYEETLHKVYFNQTDMEINFSQYITYVAKLPAINSFTMHYWFNLDDAFTTSTMFNYGLNPSSQNNDLTVQLEVSKSGQQFFTVQVNDETVSRASVNPPLGPGTWHHALHSFTPATAEFYHFLDGKLLKTYDLKRQENNLRVPGGGVAVSGQHQRTSLNMGMDQGEGLNGWFTLFQLSSKPLGPLSATTKTAVAQLASECTGAMEGDLISWEKTPRKGNGGMTETLLQSKVCGAF